MSTNAVCTEVSLYHPELSWWIPELHAYRGHMRSRTFPGIGHVQDGVYILPYLSPEFCASLMTQLQSVDYSVNPEEPEEAQIPEAVLEQAAPELFHCLSALWQGVGPALAECLWGMDPTEIVSIQAARYSAEGVAGTEWHLDKDSDVSLVVALTEGHQGGGTEVWPGAHSSVFTVPSLPVGYAMLFRGRSTLHRGLPVTDGKRNLLVHWTKIGE